jgi:hypothetical protein
VTQILLIHPKLPLWSRVRGAWGRVPVPGADGYLLGLGISSYSTYLFLAPRTPHHAFPASEPAAKCPSLGIRGTFIPVIRSNLRKPSANSMRG